MIDANGNSQAAGRGTSSAVSSMVSGRAYSDRRSRVVRSGHIDGCSRSTEFNRDASASPSRSTSDEGNLSFECHRTLSIALHLTIGGKS